MEVKAEKINPYGDDRCKTEQVREMFDSIAPAYDFMNRMMTFGIDKLWRLHPDRITGIDLSEGMIAIARKKAENSGAEAHIRFMTGDCLYLPFAQEVFDCITVAYGVRNFEHLDRGYREMHRVLSRGGMLCVIELSTPVSPLVKPFYNFYTHHIIPAVGRLVSHDVRAYSYLPESIAAVPQGDDMLQLMRDAGFTDCRFRRLTFGTCTIYTAIK